MNNRDVILFLLSNNLSSIKTYYMYCDDMSKRRAP